MLVGGWFADRARAPRAVTVVLTVTSAMLICSWVEHAARCSVGAGRRAVLFSGVALGGSRTPRDVMVKDAAPPGQIGKVFGFVSSGLPLGSALTPVPFGFLIDHGRPDLVLVLVSAISAVEPALHGHCPRGQLRDRARAGGVIARRVGRAAARQKRTLPAVHPVPFRGTRPPSTTWYRS